MARLKASEVVVKLAELINLYGNWPVVTGSVNPVTDCVRWVEDVIAANDPSDQRSFIDANKVFYVKFVD